MDRERGLRYQFGIVEHSYHVTWFGESLQPLLARASARRAQLWAEADGMGGCVGVVRVRTAARRGATARARRRPLASQRNVRAAGPEARAGKTGQHFAVPLGESVAAADERRIPVIGHRERTLRAVSSGAARALQLGVACVGVAGGARAV